MVEIPLAVLLLIALASLALGGWANSIIARILDHRRELARAARTDTDPAEPTCGCGHHIAFHDPGKGQCHAQAKVPVRWQVEPQAGRGTKQIAVEWEARPCPCRRYAGPEPLATLYAPEMAPGAVQEIATKEPDA